MYLSRVEINTKNRLKMRNLSHLGSFHNWVEQSFPDEINKKIVTRKLWRIDIINNRQYLLLLSETKPNLQKLEEYGVENSASTKNYDNYLDNLKNGMKCSFRLAANPVISIPDDKNDKRGKVIPCLSIEDQMKFLIKRAEKNGFILKADDFLIVEKKMVPLFKKGFKMQSFIKVIYEGTLTITDINLFRDVLTKGIGRKKAYGFGLMTVIIKD